MTRRDGAGGSDPRSLRAGIVGVSVWGPGLEGWEASRPILAGEAAYSARPSPPPPPAFLPANERRRTGPLVRLALVAAHEAAVMSGLPPASLRLVFGTSNGDSAVVNDILETLSVAGRPVSPTQFHNSVHNAAAGYWSIGVGSRRPATCLGCHEDTFAASLLKAVAEVRVEGEPVLLCVYDAPVPAPLSAKRPTASAFAVGLVLAPSDGEPEGAVSGRRATLAVRYRSEPARDGLSGAQPRLAALAPLAAGNPAARVLRLLEALACREEAEIAYPYLDGRLEVRLTPDPNATACSTAAAS